MFLENLKNELNVSVTENGALGYATSGKNLLDLNFAVASLRGANDKKIINMFKDAWFENKEYALKWLFFARDVRGGLGERKLFRVALKSISDELDERVIDWIIEYGRYDDLFVLLDTSLEKAVVTKISKQLAEDVENKEEGKSISLIAKWLPSENTSSKETVALARKLIRILGLKAGTYRKLLSDLRKYIDVTEVKMSAKKWSDINYEAVPSRANLIYNNAFLRNDTERRRDYLGKLEKGEAKINSAVLYPHDIVQKYMNERSYGSVTKSYDTALEAMWKGLPNYIKDDGRTIVVADGSDSMCSTIGNTNVTALSVANALAIYFAEKLYGEFQNKYITFSNRPQLVDLGNRTTLKDKLDKASRHNEFDNTNVEAVFDLILRTAVNNHLTQNQIPSNVLIISDMEFDCAGGYCLNERLFSVIADKYACAGYKLPRLVFWNVNSRTGTIPVTSNELGVALVSGFSPAIARMVLSNKTDPYEVLVEQLLSERYSQVTLAR